MMVPSATVKKLPAALKTCVDGGVPSMDGVNHGWVIPSGGSIMQGWDTPSERKHR